jgi:hypothetical protein
MDSEMMAEALAKILEELNQIKQDVRWLREHEEGRRTADHEEMAENLAALGRSIERLKRWCPSHCTPSLSAGQEGAKHKPVALPSHFDQPSAGLD